MRLLFSKRNLAKPTIAVGIQEAVTKWAAPFILQDQSKRKVQVTNATVHF